MQGPRDVIDGSRRMYCGRRNALVDGLNSLGWKVDKPKATFYVWAKTIKGHDSSSLSKLFLKEADIVVTPGVGFGADGEGYIRMALTVSEDRLRQAVERLKKVL